MNIAENLDEEKYLGVVIDRLKQQAYKIQDNVTINGQLYKYIAKKTGFELGIPYNNCFLFSRFQTPDLQTLRDFSSKSFLYTKRMKGITPLHRIFLGFQCFPVAIVDSITKETAELIKYQPRPKHWASLEFLVVFNLEKQMLHFWKLSFSAESLFEDLVRKTIKDLLVPHLENSVLYIY
jgi:hypothetical protein